MRRGQRAVSSGLQRQAGVQHELLCPGVHRQPHWAARVLASGPGSEMDEVQVGQLAPRALHVHLEGVKGASVAGRHVQHDRLLDAPRAVHARIGGAPGQPVVTRQPVRHGAMTARPAAPGRRQPDEVLGEPGLGGQLARQRVHGAQRHHVRATELASPHGRHQHQRLLAVRPGRPQHASDERADTLLVRTAHHLTVQPRGRHLLCQPAQPRAPLQPLSGARHEVRAPVRAQPPLHHP
mmetsp:Transcript_16833/g.42618  ORF Transcript_16833/g.42618 Transcript_16833/m.42618 type:complete len:237 (+) Transcript_16833:1269-1979(+)